MSQPVLHELTHHRYLRERLEAAFPDADEETLMDTLEGMTRPRSPAWSAVDHRATPIIYVLPNPGPWEAR